MKSSIIWSISKIELQNIINSSNSFKEVLTKLDLKYDSGGNYKTLKNRIKIDNIDISHILCNRYKKTKSKIKDINTLFVVDSNTNRNIIKSHIIKSNLIEYSCNKCGLKDSWQNETLVLQLEHKNGISNDNRIENLCFLCPNCHSQTKTFSGKNRKKNKIDNFCIDCKKIIQKTSKRCKSCQAIDKGKKQQKFKITKNELIFLLANKNISQIAKEHSVSFTTVRKYCKKFNLLRM